MQRRKFMQAVGGSTIALPVAARGQTYPSKPVTMVVPYSAGGPTDTLTRVLAERMQSVLGQTVIVENVTGAGGSLGVTRVARAAPDGYTVSTGNQGSHITAGAITAVPFDLLRDFKPVVFFATNPQLVIARKSMPAATLQELIAWLKANPDKATQGGGGLGSVAHIACLYFQQLSGTAFQFVPYRGAAPAMQDLVAGQIDLMIDQAANCLPQVRADKVKAYAVAAAERIKAAPDIPTAGEAGLPGFHASVWHGMWVPAATPDAIVERLNVAAREALQESSVRLRFADLGQEIPATVQQTPRALDDFQRAEIDKWAPLMKLIKTK